jgi:hypothetical protein
MSSAAAKAARRMLQLLAGSFFLSEKEGFLLTNPADLC